MDVQVQEWFANLVNDNEVVQTVGAGAEAVAKVLATSTNLESASYDEDRHEKAFDITFLNFPDPADPYFKVCHAMSRSSLISP